jgi:hypothetical protein
MWKSFFWALGIFFLIAGGETLVVEKFVMADSRSIPRLVTGNLASYAPLNGARQNPEMALSNRSIRTKDWMPWCLLAAGAVTIMYTSSLQKKSSE